MSSITVFDDLRQTGETITSPGYWRRLSLVRVMGYLTAMFLSAAVVLPVLYVVLITFRPESAVFSSELYWIPREPTLENYAAAWEGIRADFINSFIIATGTAILSLVITVPGAYALGRLNFPGKRKAFFIVVIALMFPAVLLVGPIGSAWRDLGLFNTFPGIWIAFQAFVAPFSLWILRDFFEGLPNNLEEAARVYGCTNASAIYHVIIPLSIPAIVAVTFLAFLTGWNDFLFSNLLTQSDHRPAVVTIYQTASGRGAVPWSLVLSQSFIVGAPPVALYFLAQRYMSETFAM